MLTKNVLSSRRKTKHMILLRNNNREDVWNRSWQFSYPDPTLSTIKQRAAAALIARVRFFKFWSKLKLQILQKVGLILPNLVFSSGV